MAALVRARLSGINAAIKRRPLTAAIVVTGAKAAVADLMVQVLVEQREKVDVRRVALFGCFGASYQGCFQYGMFRAFDWLVPGTSLRASLWKVFFANAIGDPVFFFPTFYTMREIASTGTVSADCVQHGLTKYSENYWDDWINSWSIWIPAHFVNFGFVPVHLRMPYVASVSFGYVCMLSFTRGDMSDKVDAEAEPTALPVVGRDAAAALHAPLHPRGTAEKT